MLPWNHQVLRFCYFIHFWECVCVSVWCPEITYIDIFIEGFLEGVWIILGLGFDRHLLFCHSLHLKSRGDAGAIPQRGCRHKDGGVAFETRLKGVNGCSAPKLVGKVKPAWEAELNEGVEAKMGFAPLWRMSGEPFCSTRTHVCCRITGIRKS